MTTSERVRRVEEIFETMGRGEQAASLKLYAADAKFHVVSPNAPMEATGVEEWERLSSANSEKDSLQLEPEVIREQAGCVIVLVGGKYTGKWKGDAEFL